MLNPQEPKLLTERQEKIFKAVVLDYIRTGEPVASGNLAERYAINLSPASIRKVLHELELYGLLKQSHSSSGRTPTEAGFKVYANDILEVRKLPSAVQALIEKELTGKGVSLESIFMICSRVLSNLTSQMGVVLSPGMGKVGLKKLYFVRLGPNQVIAVIITQNGIIQNQLITPPEDFSQEELNEVNVYLEHREVPFTLEEMGEKLLEDMRENRSEFLRIFQRAFLLTSETRQSSQFEADDSENIFLDEEGRFRLIDHPDLQDALAMRALFKAFLNKKRLMELLNDIRTGNRLRVVISPSGADMDGLALVASPYFTGGEKAGAVGVIGPQRLNYDEVVPVVDYAAQVLSGLFQK
ncbi:MAG: heat-inducible transcriptional repressor HrcA [Deltaproteobacteria bacterium]|jgi:heat-inducible transcriptional repressor|nr:heat-inducible transcriptional repressor HrcA [Deltaproteobacteria bacterium]